MRLVRYWKLTREIFVGSTLGLPQYDLVLKNQFFFPGSYDNYNKSYLFKQPAKHSSSKVSINKFNDNGVAKG
jgi:hypothetical protein